MGAPDYDALAQSALAPPPAPAGTNYDDLADQVVTMQRAADQARATQNLLAAHGTNPDVEAKALAASKTLGIPQPAAMANPDQAQQSAQLQRNTQTLAAAPGLSAFIASNPLAARIAQDDFDKLGTLDRLTTALKTGASTAIDSNALGRLGNTKQAAGLIGAATPDTDKAIETLEGRIGATPRLTGALGTVQGFAGFIAGLVDNAVIGGSAGAVGGAAVGATLGATAAGVGAIPGAAGGALAGFGLGFNVDMASVAAGNAYLKMGQMRGSDGQPLSEAGKQFGAIFTGAATYALGRYGVGAEAKVAQGTIDKLAQDAIERAVQTPTFARAAAQFGAGAAKGAATGAGVMTAMEASNILGEEIAKAMSGGHFESDPQEMVSRLAEAAVNGAVMVGALHGTMGGLGLYGDLRAASRAQAQTAMFKNLLEGAADSKLRERDLDAFQQFMQRQTDGSPVESLYVPAEKIRELYQSAQIDPLTMTPDRDPLFGFVPDMAKQLAEAGERGGDIVIPTADFVARLAGSPLAERLIPDIRVGADAMSVNEAKAFGDNYAARIKQATDEAGKASEKADSVQQIAEDVRARAVAAGRSEAEASRYGAIYAARYVARAERRGLSEDPMALYEAEGAKLNGSGKDGAPGARTFGQTLRVDTDTGLPLNEDGTVTVYHHTSAEKAAEIKRTGMLKSEGEPDLYFTTTDKTDTGYGDTAVPFRVKPSRLKLDDEFPDGRRDFSVSAPTKARRVEFTDKGDGVLYQDERGKIAFQDGKATISLFEKADASTLIHESGHAWLEELAADAVGEAAPAQLRTDIAAVREWLGNDGGEFTTEQHEQFARAAEAYLMEGKAPSAALAKVFARFKQWLTKIYRTVAALDTPINDDIRGVFDRLLATDAELAEARKAGGLEQNFKTAEEAGMTEAEWVAYTRSVEKAKQEAEAALLDKMMAKIRFQRTKQYREERAALLDDVARTIDARPDMKALRLLRSGKMPDGSDVRVRLNTDQIRETYGKDGFEALPKGITSKDGVSPDQVVEMLGGFGSGDEMVRALQSLEGQQREIRKEQGEHRGIRQYLIDQEADARMAERKGELEDPAAVRDEAEAALHGTGQAELLANELRYLRRRIAQEVKVRGAAVEGGKAETAAAKQKLADEKMSRRWDEAEQNTIAAALRDSVAITRPMLEAIRAHVDEILRGKTTAEIRRYSSYLRDEKRAAREVQEAILAKDWAAAAAAKQRQILSHILYAKAREAAEDIESGIANFKRVAAKRFSKTVVQVYTDQMHDLLQRFGFDSGRGEELQRTKGQTLKEFVEQRLEDKGIELAVDPGLYEMTGRPVDNLKLNEFYALDEAVRSMQAMGAGEKLITIDRQRVNFEEVRDEMVGAIRDLGERMKSDYYDPKDAGALAAAREKLFERLRGIDASLTKPEALFDQIDKGNPDGVMNRAVFRPLKEAQHNEDRWQDAASKSLEAAVKAAGKKWSKHLNDAVPDDLKLINRETGKPMKLTRQRMLAMALNWGNEGNRAKLADGYRWDPRVVKSFLDRNMTKADWDFVQSVWGIFDANRDELDGLQKRVTGIGLDLVQADRFTTPHGDYAGGYFPIVYDAARDFTAEKHAEAASTDALYAPQYTRATTPKGSTISRVEGVKRPIQLSLDVAPWKIGQVIHDIAFREAIMGADKLLSDNSVMRAFDDVFGSEYRKTLRPWLKHIANARNIDDAAISWIDKAIQTARTNTVIVGIGFRLSTVLKHGFTALSNSIGEIGANEMRKATIDLYRPGDAGNNSWQFIFGKSAEMRYRQNAYDKDVMAAYSHLLADSRYTAFQKAAQHYGHLAVSKFDMGSAGPVWLASYRKALAGGRTDADAIYIADKAVRNAHGAQGLTDTAAIQRAKGAAQLVNMFYGFFNHVYNRQRLIVVDAATGVKSVKAGEYREATRNFASVLARSFWYLAVPGLIEALVATQGPDENKDESWGGWAAKAVLGSIPAGIPIMRDVAKAAIEGRDYEGSPIVNAVNSVLRGGAEIYHHVADDKDFTPNSGKHIATAAGLVVGLPAAAPFTAGKFLWDYGTGEADPQSIAEWYQGLSTGKVSHE